MRTRPPTRAPARSQDADVAGDVEVAFRDAGVAVFSNARNHRMVADVPLVVPPVNGDHLALVRSQPSFAATGGFIVTNANCSTTGLVIALKPLDDAFGIEAAHVTTLQAISGAGYPGLPSLDILDNVVPYISGEEEKLETEYRKILGALVPAGGGARGGAPQRISERAFPLSAMVNRVHVRDGHSIALSLKLARPATPEQVADVLRAWAPADPAVSALPSAPRAYIEVRIAARPPTTPSPTSHAPTPAPARPHHAAHPLAPRPRRCARRRTARSRGSTATPAAASRPSSVACAATPCTPSSCSSSRTTPSWAPRARPSSTRSSPR